MIAEVPKQEPKAAEPPVMDGDSIEEMLLKGAKS